MKLSIVIPAYNEEDRLAVTLKNTLDYLKTQDFQTQVVVVSDGSRDSTVAVAKSFDGREKNVLVHALEYFPNRGKGYAVQYGMLRAQGQRVLFMDADYAVPLRELEKPMALLDAGADIAIASRALAGSEVLHHQTYLRELSGRIYTLVQNQLLGFSYPDTQCGFKMFRHAAAQDLFARQKLCSVIFDAEILWLAKKRGYKVAQFPVHWTHQEDSRIRYDNWRKSVFIFQELFRIKKLHKGEKF